MLVSHHHVQPRRLRSTSMGNFDDLMASFDPTTSPPSPTSTIPLTNAKDHKKTPGGGHRKVKSSADAVLVNHTLFGIDERVTVTNEEPVFKCPSPSEETCWDRKKIWEWYDKLPWLAGMNYLPRTAVNFVEMWDESSFDINVIEEELIWAKEKLGYNTLRTNIPMVLYEHDAQGLKKRVNLFLAVAAKHGFGTMLCPMDDCEFSGKEAKAGPQPDPVPGLHNSQAVGSPGRKVVCDPSQWYRVEEYIRWVVRTWGHDERILLLDLYNEPGNPWIFSTQGTYFVDNVDHYEECAYELMQKVFAWARKEKPSRPLTTSAWHMPDPFMEQAGIIPLAHRIDQVAMELSDVISIHAYCDPICLQQTLTDIACFGKPILLTEWMARQVMSTYDTALPTLKELKVGAYQWGLVKGKSQTYLPWPHVAHNYEGDPMWWHDVLDADGSFHDEREGEVIRSYVYPQNRAISGDHLLSELVSSGHMEHIPSSQHILGILQQDTVEQKVEEYKAGEETVIPSVCSISMATINSMAASAAAEMMEQAHHQENFDSHHNTSLHTFGVQLASQTIEGLDLELQAGGGGIEF